jgi:four helix bundle protein
MARTLVRTQRDLEVWRRAFDVSMEIFRFSKSFPGEERYSLTDQMRCSSRSVTTNITEAWRKRRYAAAFVLKLNDAEAEAAETQDWLYCAVECGYLAKPIGQKLFAEYDRVLGMLVKMITNADSWVFPEPAAPSRPRRR